MLNSLNYLGKTVNVRIDRPLGSKHPKFNFKYLVNYGYIPNIISGDNEYLDAYILSIKYPLKNFKGKCIAVLHRLNEDDDKLIIVPKNIILTRKEIENEVSFQEKWFEHILYTIEGIN